MRKKEPSNGNNNTYAKEQAKHLKRIRSFIRDAQKRGYIFFDKKVPKDLSKIKTDIGEYAAPRTVKNPTAVTVKRLEKITKESLYAKAIWIDPQTGAVHTSEEGRHIENSRRSQKAAETRKLNKQEKDKPYTPQPPPEEEPYYRIFDTVMGYIKKLQSETTGFTKMDNERSKNARYLTDFFDDCLQSAKLKKNLHGYAQHLESKASEIAAIVDTILPASNSETVEICVGSLLEILNQRKLTSAEYAAYQDAMEYGTGEEEYR